MWQAAYCYYNTWKNIPLEVQMAFNLIHSFIKAGRESFQGNLYLYKYKYMTVLLQTEVL